MKKIAIVSVTNDLVTDYRVHKTCMFLMEENYNVILVGRKFSNSLSVARPYVTKRFRLFFNKKVFFYAEYNLRLFFYLLFKKVDLLVANDLDTLLANYLIAKLKRVPILYDSHEYFTEVPELINRKKIQRIWEKIESYIFPKLPLAITVSNSIANIYSKKYGIPVYVIRNVPEINVKYKIIDIRKELNLHHKPILLYQGSLNIGRGIEFLVESMSFLENVYLLIIGSGDIEQDLKRKVKELNLQDKVIFLGKIENQKLKSITPNALLGFSLEENRGMNYRFALPNKIFDYIHASVPVICSDLPEMKTIVEKYKIGLSLNYYQMTAEAFANTIKNIVKDNQTISFWKNNCAIASKELCWENEKLKFKEILAKLITN